jgi:hypothetical protein
MADNSIDIAVTLKDLTAEGFAQIKEALGGMGESLDEAKGKGDDFLVSWTTIAEGVAAVGAIAVAAIAAVGAAVFELGEKGSEIDTVTAGFDRLAGGIGPATEALKAMQDGTKGTVDNLTLMTDANHLLAVGAVSGAADLGTLTQASMILAKEFGGDTQDSINAVSRALETGRVGRLAMQGVTIDAVAAEAAYATAHGITGQALDATQKKEADRAAVLEALQKVVADAGDQELTFADRIKQGETAVSNFIDDLGRAVDQSPVLAAALDGVGKAFGVVFGTDQQGLITGIITAINKFAIDLVDAGIGATQVATVFVSAWGVIDTLVLGVTTGLTGFVTGLLIAYAKVEDLAALLPFATQATKDNAKAADDNATAWKATTGALADQTAEAALMVTGHSALNQTIDAVGGSLLITRDSMIALSASTATQTDAAGAVTTATAAHSESSKSLTAQLKEQQTEQDELAAATKDFSEALQRQESLGQAYGDVLKSISADTLASAEADVRKGLSLKDVGILYGLNADQAKAVGEAVKDLDKTEAGYSAAALSRFEDQYKAGAEADLKLLQSHVATVEATQKLEEDAATATNQVTMSAIDFKIAQNLRWYNDQVLKETDAEKADAAYNAALLADWQAKDLAVRASNDATIQAVLKTQTDLQSGWVTTFDQTLASTDDFGKAFKGVFDLLKTDVESIAADMLGSMVQGFLQPLMDKASSVFGSLAKGLLSLIPGGGIIGAIGGFLGSIFSEGGVVPERGPSSSAGFSGRSDVVYAAQGVSLGPQGTDTVPAWLTPGERVLSRDQNAAFERSGGTGGDAASAVHAMHQSFNRFMGSLPTMLGHAVANAQGART